MLSSPESRSPSPEPIKKKLSSSKGFIPPLSQSGYGKGYVGGTAHYSEHAFKRHVDGKLDILTLDEADSKHVHLLKGTFEIKISKASGSRVTFQNNKKLLMIVGEEGARARARDYTRILLKLASGHVKLDVSRVRDDVTLVHVPYHCVRRVAGKNGEHLQKIEHEFGTLMLFPSDDSGSSSSSSSSSSSTMINQKNASAGGGSSSGSSSSGSSSSGSGGSGGSDGGVKKDTKLLAIFGMERARQSAELKIMSMIEKISSGYFTHPTQGRFVTNLSNYMIDSFGTETVPVMEENFRSGSMSLPLTVILDAH